MFKPVIIAKKSWWVPAENRQKLAVEISRPEDYRQAIRWKMETLVESQGLEAAYKTANQINREDGGLPLEPPANSEHLVNQMLENSRVLEMIKWGSPEKAQPASREDAMFAVKDQPTLNWGVFLT